MGDTMETVTIRVYYDFASTLCYVAHRVMCRIEQEIGELGVVLEWRPIDLTMAAPWDRGDSFRPDIRAAVRNTGLALGIDVEMPDPWLDSRPASQVALSLRTPADEARWRRAVFDTFFDRKTPRLTPDLVRLARDLTGLESIPDEAQGFDRVEECTREAIALGVTGVPSFLLDNWLFGGVYDDELMVSILQPALDPVPRERLRSRQLTAGDRRNPQPNRCRPRSIFSPSIGELRMAAARAWNLRYALRSLRRSPAFVALTVSTLGLAIGAVAGIWSVVDTVLLDPLPYPHADRLVVIAGTAPGSDLPEEFALAPEFYLQYREQADLLDGVAIYNSFTSTLRTDDRVERIRMSMPTARSVRHPRGPTDPRAACRRRRTRIAWR